MSHTLFDCPLLSPSHDLEDTNPVQRIFPVEKRDAPEWNISKGIQVAKGNFSTLASYYSFDFRAAERRITHRDTSSSKVEAAFWLTMLSQERFIRAMLTRNKDLIDQCELDDDPAHIESQLDDRAFLDSLFTLGEFEVEDHASNTILLRFKHAVALAMIEPFIPSYIDRLSLLIEYAAFDRLYSLGPPPEADFAQALAMIEQPLIAHIEQVQWLDVDAYCEHVRYYPSEPIIDAFIDRVHRDSPHGTYLSPVLFADRDDDRLDWRVRRHLRKCVDDQKKPSGDIVKHTILRFGFSHLDLLREVVRAVKKKPRAWISYSSTLSHFTHPEAAVFAGICSSNGAAFSEIMDDTIERCAGALAMCHERGACRKMGRDYLIKRMALYADVERDRILSLLPYCSKSVQKLVKKEVLHITDKDLIELPEPLWVPWMHELSVPHSTQECVGELFAPVFDQLAMTVFAGAHYTYLFPKRVLLGLFHAQRTNRLHLLSTFSERHTELFDHVLYRLDIERVLLAMLDEYMKHEWPEAHAWFIPLLGMFGGRKIRSSLSRSTPSRKKNPQHPAHALYDEALGHLPPRRMDVAASTSVHDDLSSTQVLTQQGFGNDPADWDFYARHRDLLDEESTLVLDYGARKITMQVSATGQVSYITPDREVSETMPKVKSSDARTRANASRKAARSMLPSLKSAFNGLHYRLTASMIQQHAYQVAAWSFYLGSHPVNRLFANTLIWGLHTPDGERVTLVLPSDDGTFIDEKMDAVHIPADHMMVPIHRLDLTSSQREAWLGVLGEFEIIQAFPQLERGVYLPGPGSRDLIKTVMGAPYWLASKSLSGISPQCTSAVVEGKLVLSISRQIEGSALALDFGKGWERKQLRSMHFDGERVTLDGLDALPPLYFSELMHFLVPKYEGKIDQLDILH